MYDLGAGRGRGCFWLRGVLGCRAVGIDIVPEFIQTANRVKESFHIDRLDFRLEDMSQADLREGTVFYIYGNFLPDETLHQVARKA